MSQIRKTIYVPNTLIEKLGSYTSFSQRIIDLVQKGLLYEQGKTNKVTLREALGFFNDLYRKKHPDEPLP